MLEPGIGLTLSGGVARNFDPFSDEEQGHLRNWGYALCDAALRRFVPNPAYPMPA